MFGMAYIGRKKRRAPRNYSFQAEWSWGLNEPADGAIAIEVVRAEAPKAWYWSSKSKRFPFQTKIY